MSAATFTISPPFISNNLTIFLLHGADSWTGEVPLTLEEAIDSKQFVVHETGHVNQLSLENLSEFEVFLQAGDIVKGGLQDRIFGFDLIVPARSGRVPIDSFCVESGRWRQRRGSSSQAEVESDRVFNSSKHRITSKEIKLAAMHYCSQTEVWDSVHRQQFDLGNSLSSDVRDEVSASSLQLSLEKPEVEQTTDRYLKVLQPIIDGAGDDVIGYAFAINGELNSAEIYGTGRLFRKLWPRLLRSSAVEALSKRFGEHKIASLGPEEVRQYLLQAEADGQLFTRDVSPRVRIVTREKEHTIVQETRDRGHDEAWIHRNYLVI